ncbi:phage terminase small subunit [Oceanobacillus sp. CF4.6]|uniref:phage terminase small subunit n=1 Tax=Oceanobacillus sp. CF4.6 TaxID=3373080 RepID=UPI003EE6BB8C
MARKRDPRRNEAFEIWKKHKGDITNRSIGEQLDVPEKTISSWKSRDKWNEVLHEGVRSTAKEKRSTTNARMNPDEEGQESKASFDTKNKIRSRYREGSRKGAGNPSPDKKFTKRNSAALKHGLFSKHIPQETLDIMGQMGRDDPADLIWDQIMIQYAAIIRAQHIMYVEDKYETIKELKKLKVESGFGMDGQAVEIPVEQEYEIQFAWDRHASFMNAQSRAMSEFRSLIKQFNEMAYDDDERLLKLEQMQLGIEKTRAEIDRMSDDGDDDPIEILIKRKGDG